MNDVNVLIRPSVAKVEMQGQPYVSRWTLVVDRNEKRYEIQVLTRGNIESEAGVSAINYWKENDPNTRLRMRESGMLDGKWDDAPLSIDGATQIQRVLKEVRDGKQTVDDLPHIKDEVVDFLEPRIVVGAGMLDDYCTVRVGTIDDKLREEREGREEPPMPIT